MVEQSLVHAGDCVHTVPMDTFKCAISSQQHLKHYNTTNLMQTWFRLKACDQTLQAKQIKIQKNTPLHIIFISLKYDCRH